MKKLIFTILLVAAVLLGTNFALQGVGEKIAQEQHLQMMQMLLPGAESFVKEAYAGEDTNIVSVHKAENGYVIETKTHGYADEIRVLVGVDLNGRVMGLVVLEAHETFGLGSRILTDHAFLSQFLNGNGSFTVGAPQEDSFSSATGDSVSTGDETQVDGISGATVSSKAVARCVNSAIAYVTGADAGSSATEWGG